MLPEAESKIPVRDMGDSKIICGARDKDNISSLPSARDSDKKR